MSKTEQRKYVRELMKLIDKGVDNTEHLKFLTYLKDNYKRVKFNHYEVNNKLLSFNEVYCEYTN